MTMIETFIWGFAGSIAVEVANLYQVFQSDEIIMPERYKLFSFWVIRFLLAVIAGGLALAYKINTPLLAANIGASTPLILHALAKGIQATPSFPNDTPPKRRGRGRDKTE